MSTLVYFILIMVMLLGLAVSVGYILNNYSSDKDVEDEIYDIILRTNKRLHDELTADEENYILWNAILEIEHTINKK